MSSEVGVEWQQIENSQVTRTAAVGIGGPAKQVQMNRVQGLYFCPVYLWCENGWLCSWLVKMYRKGSKVGCTYRVHVKWLVVFLVECQCWVETKGCNF